MVTILMCLEPLFKLVLKTGGRTFSNNNWYFVPDLWPLNWQHILSKCCTPVRHHTITPDGSPGTLLPSPCFFNVMYSLSGGGASPWRSYIQHRHILALENFQNLVSYISVIVNSNIVIFLSNIFKARLKSDSIGLSVVAFVSDQFIKQHSIWEKIIEWRNILAALHESDGLIYLKFARLNLTVFERQLTWFLKDSVGSNTTPIYLNSFTICISSCFKNMFERVISICRLENIIQTVFFRIQ